MEDKPKEQQISSVIKAERRTKGKRGPAALGAGEEQKQLANDFDYQLRRGTEAQFSAKLKQLQLPAESGGVEKLLRLFHELRRS
jgi:hypothetical protein